MTRSPHTVVVLNPGAGSYDASVREAVRELGDDLAIHETRGPGDATRLVTEARDAGARRVIVGGGDGTVNEAVQALAVGAGELVLGVLPLGTGNDLAGTLDIPAEPREAIRVLAEARPSRLDLMRVVPEGGAPRWGLNVCVGGTAGRIGAELSPQTKATWGPLAYAGRGLGALLGDLEAHQTRLRWADGTVEERELLGMVVANGRTCGGGWRCAPEANPEDGLLDVLLVHEGAGVELADAVAHFAAGEFGQSALVTVRRVAGVRLEAHPPMPFNIDGERLPEGPIDFGIQPGALRVLVGPEYQAEVGHAAP